MKLPLFLIFAVVLELCTAAKILFLIPMPARSHYNLGDRLTEELLKKGHEVTVVAAFRRPNPIKNLTEVVIPDFSPAFSKNVGISDHTDGKFNMRHMSPLGFLMFSSIGELLMNETMNSDVMKKFMKIDQKFDLVIGECFLVEGLLAGFSQKFKAPIVALATFMPNTWANEMVGNPSPSSYIPEPILGFSDEMTFCERLLNFLYSTLAQFMHYFRHLPGQERIMKKYFGDDLPPIKDIISKTSLVLVNHHYSLAFPRPYLPNMVEIGSYHVKPPKPLPKDIQVFMDEAKDGVIFFSMGSNLLSSEFPKEKFDGLLNIFSKLKQRVLWKFETDNVSNLPKNIKISKWLPQSDILAHPNIKLFITHGGLLSITEAVLRAVPVVGIPIFGDQPLNMRQVEKLEIGVSLRYEDIGEHKMYEAIMEVLSNPKYSRNMKHRSQLLQDVPIPQIDLATYWIEYVIRHKGAPHLISGAQDLTWYQLYLIDVYLALGAILFLVIYVPLTLIRFLKRTLCGKNSKKVKSSKKKN